MIISVYIRKRKNIDKPNMVKFVNLIEIFTQHCVMDANQLHGRDLWVLAKERPALLAVILVIHFIFFYLYGLY